MLEGLSIVRLLGWLKTSRTAVKPHRSKAVWYAGRGVDGNSRLEALTNHLVRVALPPFVQCARLMTRARSIPVIQPYAYCLAWDSLRDTYGGRGFRLIDSSLLSQSAVRSLGAIKREEPNQGSAHSVLQIRKEVLGLPVCRFSYR